MSLGVEIMNIGFSAAVLALVVGLLGWAIHSSRNDDTKGARATRGRPMPRPSFPTPRLTLRRPSPGRPTCGGLLRRSQLIGAGRTDTAALRAASREPAGDLD
jgi:hypothetical protein